MDSLIRYVANPHYWGGEVPTKHLIFSITPNVETRLAKLQTNECQIIPAPSPVQFAVIKNNKDLTLHGVEALNVGYLAFNTAKKPFDDVRVRRALNYATDKKAIVNAVFMGSGTVAKSMLPPHSPATPATCRTTAMTLPKRRRCWRRRALKRAPR